MTCDHELTAEYLYPSDVVVSELYDDNGTITIRFVVPCPDCDAMLCLTAPVEQITESELDLPLDTEEDRYD